MGKKIRKYFEVTLLQIASYILIKRNVNRCKVVSRRDNNEMWYMSEKIDAICVRMIAEYKDL